MKVAPELVERIMREGCAAFEPTDPLPEDARLTGVEWDVDEFERVLAVLVFHSPTWTNEEPVEWCPVFRTKGGF